MVLEMFNNKDKSERLLQEFYDERSPVLQQKLIEEAMELDPENLLAQLIHMMEFEEIHEGVKRLEKVLTQYLIRNQKSIRQYKEGDFHPYFAAKYVLIDYYFARLLYKSGEKHAKDFLRMNPSDNAGVRYLLMASYVNSFQHKKAQDFFKRELSANSDEIMLFLMIVSLILDENRPLVSKYVSRLLEENPYYIDFFKDDEFHDEYVYPFDFKDEDEGEEAILTMGTYDSAADTIFRIVNLLIGSDYLYLTLKNEIEKVVEEKMNDIKPNNVKIFMQESNDLRNQHNQLLKMAKELRRALDFGMINDCFEGISPYYARILINKGYKEAKDFKKVTEQQLLAIEGIGPSTLKKLKANGVVFKVKKSKKK